MGTERPTLDDWLRGDVPRQTREETRAAHRARTQVRERSFIRRLQNQSRLLQAERLRRDLYRRLLSRG